MTLFTASLFGAAIAAASPTPTSTPAFSEAVTVVATRFELPADDAPASVVTIGREHLALAPAPALDDTLRQVPGFALFRRSGSRTANPTSQGVSLRGVGASGASRAAVLCDGVPLSDPFGGWVYWSRVPRAAVERVEILRGGGSSLYGSGALGGVIRLFRQETGPRAARLEASMATQETPEASAFGRTHLGSWTVDAAGEFLRTDGYILVDDAERGSIDTPASSRHATGELSLARALGNRGRAFVRGSLFDESRGNGTVVQENDTRIRQASAGMDWTVSTGRVAVRAFAADQDYAQTFSTIDAGRNSERLNRTQDVAARSLGGSAEWLHSFGARHRIAAGVELRRVRGENDEVAIAGTTRTPSRVEGRQRLAGVFAEDHVQLGPRTSLTLGLRADQWRNDDARRTTGGTTADLASRSESALSPRAALVQDVGRGWTIVSSAYRAFRAPTLNELYRSFRVGNVLTQANESLEAERLTGLDAGVRWSPPAGRFTVAGTAFRMTVEDPIANVTVASTPALIERQRRNLGRTRTQGLELEGEWRPSSSFRVAAAYLLSDARVRSFPADRALEGRRVPQVARHGASVQAHVSTPAARAWIQARWSGAAYDDDLNALRLGPFATIDARLERPWGPASVFVAAENLLDTRYDVGRTPTRTIGPPRALRAGLTLDVGGRGTRR
jgi:outer membrane receptor protein involved in Fe transport